MKMKQLIFALAIVILTFQPLRADLLGYWSANSTAGQGEDLPNDQGNSDLDGELIDASYSADAKGHTGAAGDYAISFEGFDEDYAVIPPTEETFEEITITGWVNGFPNGDWAGIISSRDPGGQPLYLGFQGGTTDLAYVWNSNSAETWGWVSEVPITEEEWTFVALTVNSEAATVYAGVKGGELVSNVNEIDHFEQDNLHEWRLAEDDCCGGGRNFSGLMDDFSIWDEALSEEQLMQLHTGTATPLTLAGGGMMTPGDFDGNGQLDAADLDLLAGAMMTGDGSFDLDGDADADFEDRQVWVVSLANTYFGDANLDGEFNSSDFVAVFQAGLFEKAEAATWAQGDWNGDGRFDSSDFVTAFQDGGFEIGPRQATASVPEPTSLSLMFLAIVGLLRWRK